MLIYYSKPLKRRSHPHSVATHDHWCFVDWNRLSPKTSPSSQRPQSCSSVARASAPDPPCLFRSSSLLLPPLPSLLRCSCRCLSRHFRSSCLMRGSCRCGFCSSCLLRCSCRCGFRSSCLLLFLLPAALLDALLSHSSSSSSFPIHPHRPPHSRPPG